MTRENSTSKLYIELDGDLTTVATKLFSTTDHIFYLKPASGYLSITASFARSFKQDFHLLTSVSRAFKGAVGHSKSADWP